MTIDEKALKRLAEEEIAKLATQGSGKFLEFSRHWPTIQRMLDAGVKQRRVIEILAQSGLSITAQTFRTFRKRLAGSDSAAGREARTRKKVAGMKKQQDEKETSRASPRIELPLSPRYGNHPDEK